jgi:hypothetical protein
MSNCPRTSLHRGTLAPCVVVFLVVAAIAAVGSLTVRAQPPPPAADVLTALLAEVRGLRAAMEQMASAGPRVQLSLGRVQLQEQRIVNQIRRLDALKISLVAARNEATPLERGAKGLEEHIRDFPNSQGRREDEKELAEVKRELAEKQSVVQRLMTEETLLEQDIAAEQNRWTDFNRRLEELERALTPR